MHQNQWLAAIEDLRSEGFEDTMASGIAYEYGKNEYAYQFWNHSEGEESAEGRWASGPSIDGKGEFQYVATPIHRTHTRTSTARSSTVPYAQNSSRHDGQREWEEETQCG